MVKLEGMNRIYLDDVCDSLCARFGFKSKAKAMVALCEVVTYNVVLNSIEEQIDYLLDTNGFRCDKSTLLR